MKKIILILAAFLCNEVLTKEALPNSLLPKDSRFTTALTSGVVINLDRRYDRFQAIDVLTVDGCYNFTGPLGVGAKLSCWVTPPSKESHHALIYQVPLTTYLRTTCNFQNGLRAYGSFGGGLDFLLSTCCGFFMGPIAEAEVGLNYPAHNRVNFTTACRYVFPHNALDLRLGVAFEI